MYLIKYKEPKIVRASELKAKNVIKLGEELYVVKQKLGLDKDLKIFKISDEGGDYYLPSESRARFGQVIRVCKVGYLVDGDLVEPLPIENMQSLTINE